MIRTICIGLISGTVALLGLALTRHEGVVVQVAEPAAVRLIEERSAALPASRPINPAVNLSRSIGLLVFDQVPLEKAIETWRQRVGCNVFIHWQAVEEFARIARDAPITLRIENVPAVTALRMILEAAGYAEDPVNIRDDDGVVVVDVMRWDRRARAYVRVYDVRDLVRAELEFHRAMGFVPLVARGQHLTDYLADLIMATAAPGSWWEQGNAGVISRWGGRLIILQSPEAHGEIERLLAKLRESAK